MTVLVCKVSRWWPPVFLAIGLGLFAVGCKDLRSRLYRPRMKTVCEVLEGRCRFENQGDPGEVCLQVIVLRTEDGSQLKSAPVCSGLVPTNGEAWKKLTFPSDPLRHCLGPLLKGNFKKNCSVELRDLPPGSPSGEKP